MNNDWTWHDPDPDGVLAQLDGDPGTPATWHRHGVALALAGRVDELLNFCDRAASRFGSALKVFHNILLDLAESGAWAEITAIQAKVPRSRLEYAVALYYRGCAHIARGAHVTALKWFDDFKASVLPRHRQFPVVSDGNFNLIFRQGTLVESPLAVARLADPPEPQAMTFCAEAPPEPPPHVAACVLDSGYFLRFAVELCQSHGQLGTAVPVHFHILAATAEALAATRTLPASFPGLQLRFSFEPAGRWDHPVYYACARFLVMRRLFQHYRAPVITQDADIASLRPVQQYADAAVDSDFACFMTGRTEPASVYQASIMVFSPTQRGLDFIDDLCRFTTAKLDLPPVLGWMLDQAALFSVLTHRTQADPGFRFAALDQRLQIRLENVIRQLSTVEEKGRIMNRCTRAVE